MIFMKLEKLSIVSQSIFLEMAFEFQIFHFSKTEAKNVGPFILSEIIC